MSYTRFVLRKTRKSDNPTLQLQNWIVGAFGEVGEIIDLLKKHKFHGHPLDTEKLKLELGDTLFYVTATLVDCGYDGLEALVGGDPALYTRQTGLSMISAGRHQRDLFYWATQAGQYVARNLEQLNQKLYGDLPLDKHQIMVNCRQIVKLITSMGICIECTLPEILLANEQKLNKRYKEGFTVDESKNRTSN